MPHPRFFNLKIALKIQSASARPIAPRAAFEFKSTNHGAGVGHHLVSTKIAVVQKPQALLGQKRTIGTNTTVHCGEGEGGASP